MPWDEEKQHGVVEEVVSKSSSQQPRARTTQEKLEATSVDIASHRDSTFSGLEEDNNPNNSNGGYGPRESLKAAHGKEGILTRLRRLEAAMDRKLGIESAAIDRKRPEDRPEQPWHAQLNMALMWASGTLNLSCFATGFLGWEFGLDLKQSILITVFACLLGGAVAGFCATMGAATGLRQMSISRYSFGWFPNKVIAALNAIQQLGWSAVGCITGGLALTAVSEGGVSIALGIIIIAGCSLVVSFIGLRAILVYEKYAWSLYFIVFVVILAMTGGSADNHTPSSLSGLTLTGTVLNLLAILYGGNASWATLASDYYVHYPVDTNRTRVFLLTTLGISLPTSLSLIAGNVVASALNTQPAWAHAYETRGLGFVISTMLHPAGFGKVVLILLVLSGINMNIINTYSAALSFQQLSRPLGRVPRILWTLVCGGIIIALALAGRNQLLTYLQNFLALLGYWCTSYFVIVCSEHYVFRRGDFGAYDLEGWNEPARLPMGIAAGTAFLAGAVAWVLGMTQTWFVGPIARQLGDAGGDVGNQLCLVVTFVTFLPARYLELKYVGR